ncbi:unnamed protein product [Camellia sinensis]
MNNRPAQFLLHNEAQEDKHIGLTIMGQPNVYSRREPSRRIRVLVFVNLGDSLKAPQCSPHITIAISHHPLSIFFLRFPCIFYCQFKTPAKMQNEEGQNMDLYIPRKCSATNRLITAKDHASVQLNVGHLDDSGVYTGTFTTFALCGFVRAQGDADSAVDRLWQKKKVEARQQ